MIQSRIETHEKKQQEDLKNTYKEIAERWMDLASEYEEEWNIQQKKIIELKAVLKVNRIIDGAIFDAVEVL